MVSPFSFTQVYNNFSLKGGTRGRQRKLVNLLRSNGFSTQTMLVCMSLYFRLIQLHFSNVSLEKRTNSNRRRRKRRSVKRLLKECEYNSYRFPYVSVQLTLLFLGLKLLPHSSFNTILPLRLHTGS